ncbi:DUF3833 domain-containing protein [Endozoicomonas sp. OPT23]|uniref:DUF3833 domain-containing protein n=1 Tax=Endozoicomonas sp. OPT23 TaxID=2072845 RepID=UPI00129B0B20|nr:DUF3833 domain-containing protein [Endozoicomonas sp. OPT23]MRI31852.1 DUF3833 domain-containing protein [Endozoicomonas sp. OPT23]
MKKFCFFFSALLALTVLPGCTTMDIEYYKNETPELKVEEYFLGETLAWGMFQDRFGKVRNRFKVVMRGRVENDTLILDEQFEYSDGTTSDRLWKLKILPDGHYEGSAGDVIGKAIGKWAGNSFNWKYEMDLAVSGSNWRVSFDDWLYLQEDGTLINIATVSKWGIKLGTLTFVFAKEKGMAEAFRGLKQ